MSKSINDKYRVVCSHDVNLDNDYVQWIDP